MNKELLSYISNQLGNNLDAVTVAKKLEEAGWAWPDIIQGFRSVGHPLSQQQLDALGISENELLAGKPDAPPQPKIDEIPGVIELLQEAFKKFKQGAGKLLLMTFLPGLIVFIIGVILILIFGLSFAGILSGGGADLVSSLISSLAYIIPAALIGFAVLFYFQIWIQLATMYLVSDPGSISIQEAFGKTRGKIFKFWWLMLLNILIVLGGTVALIVPGIILSLWLVFAPYILIFEDKGGLKALITSREYMRGQAWGVFGRFLGGSLLLVLPLIILSLFAQSSDNGLIALINLIANLVYPSFLGLYTYLIYNYARRVKADAEIQIQPKQKLIYTIWAVLGIAGMVLPFVILSRVIGTIDPVEQMQNSRNLQQQMDQLEMEVETEYNNNTQVEYNFQMD